MKIRSVLAGLLILLLCFTATGCKQQPAEKAPQQSGATVGKDTSVGTALADDIQKTEIAALKGTQISIDKLKLSDYITLGNYKGLEVKPEEIKVSDEALQKLLKQKLQESSYVTYSDPITSGKVQDGDICSIDYVGKKDGVAFEGGTDSCDLEIGSGTFIPGFEEGLIGKKIGSTVDLNLTFPENYHNKELQGQAVVFTVTINKVTRKSYKELTDELATTLDKTVQSADEYMAKLEKQLYDELEETLKYRLWDTAIANCTFKEELPDTIEAISRRTFYNYYYSVANQYQFESLGAFLSANKLTEDAFLKSAQQFTVDQTKGYLLALAICEAEGYTVTKEMMDKKANEAIENGKASGNGYQSLEEYYSVVGEATLCLQLHYTYAIDLVLEQALGA
ncbi:MAG: FKBP-type peptidyl-prolyl cis-trans isomerase [Clostridia bacterium]|nr:FKBP-type peptidyl-prolyl cis-trans isomerase [Clostridia bacterium]